MHRPTQLHMLADLQSYIGRQLQEIYDASRSGDFTVCDELSRALINADKMVLIIRAIGEMVEKGTPKRFDEQEAKLLDQLERSFTVVEGKRKAEITRFPGSPVNRISYVAGQFDGGGDTCA